MNLSTSSNNKRGKNLNISSKNINVNEDKFVDDKFILSEDYPSSYFDVIYLKILK